MTDIQYHRLKSLHNRAKQIKEEIYQVEAKIKKHEQLLLKFENNKTVSAYHRNMIENLNQLKTETKQKFEKLIPSI